MMLLLCLDFPLTLLSPAGEGGRCAFALNSYLAFWKSR